MKREDIYAYEEVVLSLLRHNKELRDSDSKLYLEVLRQFGYDTKKSIEYYYSNNADYPRYDSITRVRRRVQQMNPSLRCNNHVKTVRRLCQEKYNKYSKTGFIGSIFGVNK